MSKQIHVKKYTKNPDGSESVREMTLPEAVWNRQVKKKAEVGIRWELQADKNDQKEKELMPPKEVKVSTKPVVEDSKEENTEAIEDVNYDNYTDQELRVALKNAGIKYGNIEKRDALIKKLKANG